MEYLLVLIALLLWCRKLAADIYLGKPARPSFMNLKLYLRPCTIENMDRTCAGNSECIDLM